MKIKTKEALTGYAFASPIIAGFTVFFLVPFIISIFYCFTEGIGTLKFVGLKNFNSLLHSSSFLLAVKNTFEFNIVCVPLIMAISLLFAVMLNKKLKGITYFRSFFILPLVIPVASVILVWNIMFDQYGALNKLLVFFHITPVEWMRSRWSFWILVIVYIWKNCGYNVILFLAGLNSIPKDFYEAAYIDGAGKFACLKAITIPLLAPTGFFVFIISIINSFKVFREAYLLAGKYPYKDMYMLQHFMNNNFYNLSYQRLTTAAALMALFILLLVLALFKFEANNGRSLDKGAIKKKKNQHSNNS
ncbi:MAG: sugar ABC transporter permease [Bacillota bacterium]|nr:sugar ABC transporter permease [Bacillota bacterium]